MRVFASGRRYGDGCRAAAAHAASASSRGLRYAMFTGRSLAASKHRLLQRCRHMASKVQQQTVEVVSSTSNGRSSSGSGSRRARIAVRRAPRGSRLRLPAGSKSAAVRLATLLQQPQQAEGPEGEAQLLLLLQLGRSLRTEDLAQSLTFAFSQSQTRALSLFNWQLAFAVVRLLGERRDLAQAMSSAQRMEGLCAVMQGLMARGIQPRSRRFFEAAQAVLTNASADLTLEQQASILTCLAAMPQRTAVPLASLLAVTQRVTAVAAFQHSMQSSPGGVSGAQASQGGDGAQSEALAVPSSLARAVGALCWLLKQQRTSLLQQQAQSTSSAEDVEWQASPDSPLAWASSGSLGSADEEGWGGPGTGSGAGSVSISAALQELCVACAPLTGGLGPQVVGSLVQTCGLLGARTPMSMLQAFLAHVSAAEGVAQQLWCRALGRGLASLDPTAGDEVLQSLAQRLAGLAAGKVDSSSAGTLLSLLAEDTREQLFQQRSEGYTSPSAAGAEVLGRAVARAFAAGSCSADTAACAACCLADSVMAEDDGDSSSSETLLVLQEMMLQLRSAQLSASAACDVLVACLATHGKAGDASQQLAEQAVTILTTQPLDQVPARSLVAVLASTSVQGTSSTSSSSSSSDTSPSAAQLGAVRSRCLSALAARPLPQLLQVLGSARKLQLMWTMLRLAPASDAPTPSAGVEASPSRSYTEQQGLLDSALQCGAAVCHLLAPQEVTQLLQRLSLRSSAHPSPGSTDATIRASANPLPGSARAVLLPRLSALMLSSLPSYSDAQLLSACRSLAALRFRPGLLLRDVCVRLLPSLPDLPPQSGVWLLWSLASLNHRKPISFAVARACLTLANRQAAQLGRITSPTPGRTAGSPTSLPRTDPLASASGSMDEADYDDLGPTPAQLAVMVWACGRLSFRDDALLKPALQRLIRTSGQLSLRLVSNVVWACARLGYSTERLSAWATSHLSTPASTAPGTNVASPLADVSGQTLSNLCWGLWRLGHRPPPPVLAQLTAAAARCLCAEAAAPHSSQEQLAEEDVLGVGHGVNGHGGGVGASAALQPQEVTALLSALAGWGATLPHAALLAVEARVAAAAEQLLNTTASAPAGPSTAFSASSGDALMASGSSGSISISSGGSSGGSSTSSAPSAAGQLLDNGQGFNTHMLAGCVWALVQLHHRPSQRTLTLVGITLQQLLLQWPHRQHSATPDLAPSHHSTLATSSSSLVSASTIPLTAPAPSTAPDVLVGDFLRSCFHCGFRPEALLDTYASQLHQRLAAAYGHRLSPQRQAGVSGRRPASAVVLPTPDAAGLANAALALGLHQTTNSHKSHRGSSSSSSSNGSSDGSGGASTSSPSGLELARLIEAAAIALPNQPGPTHVQLSRLLHGMSLMGHCPREWFARGLPRLLRRLLPRMASQQLAHTVTALASWPLQQLMSPAEHQHLLHSCLAPALEARLAAEAAVAGAQAQVAQAAAAAAAAATASGDGGQVGVGDTVARSGAAVPSSRGVSGSGASSTGTSAAVGGPALAGVGARGRATGAPGSTSALLFLLNGMATLGVYRRPAADAVLSWLMQRGERPWERRGASRDPGNTPSSTGNSNSSSNSTGISTSSSNSTGSNSNSNNVSSTSVARSAPGAASSSAGAEALPLYRLESVRLRDLVYLVWSLGRLRHDHPEVLQAVGQLIMQRCGAPLGSAAAGYTAGSKAGAGSAALGSNVAGSSGSTVDTGSAALGSSAGAGTGAKDFPAAAAAAAAGGVPADERLSQAEVVQLLWAWAKLNRNPGQELLDELHRQWAAAATHSAPAARQSSSGSSGRAHAHTGVDGVQYHELTVVLYSLAILRQHAAPLALEAAEQLADKLTAYHQRPQQQQQQQWTGDAASPGGSGSAPEAAALAAPVPGPGGLVLLPRIPSELRQQLRQVAAVLLAAQADRTVSPLSAALPAEVKAAAIAAWREHVAKKAAKRPNRHQREVASAAARLGLEPQLGALTPDGVACPDVLVGLPQSPSARFALELVGPHNSAANGMRLLGDATIKYRLLQARGYIVIPIPCAEWDALGEQGAGAKSLYLQNKLDRVIEVAAAMRPSQGAASAPVVPAVPLSEAVGGGVRAGVGEGARVEEGEEQAGEGPGVGEERGFTRTVLPADGGTALRPWDGSAGRRTRQQEQQQGQQPQEQQEGQKQEEE